MTNIFINNFLQNLDIEQINKIARFCNIHIDESIKNEKYKMLEAFVYNNNYNLIVMCVNDLIFKEKNYCNYIVSKLVKGNTFPLKCQYEAFSYMHKREKETCAHLMQNEPIPYGIGGGILAYEVGLGKTYISIIYSLLTYSHSETPTLVITTPMLINSFVELAKEYLNPQEFNKILVIETLNKNLIQNINYEILNNYKIILTSYTFILACYKHHKKMIPNGDSPFIKQNDNNTFMFYGKKFKPISKNNLYKYDYTGHLLFHTVQWNRIIFDEIHKIATPTIETHIACALLSANYKWGLTGTPTTAKVMESFYGILGVIGYNEKIKKKEWPEKLETGVIQENFVLHRDANMCGIYIKEYNLHIIEINNYTEKEEQIYLQASEKVVQYLERAGQVERNQNVLNLILKLRQISICPYVLDPTTYIDPEYSTSSAKMLKVLEICREKVAKGEKTLIYTDYISACKIVKQTLEMNGIYCLEFNGDYNKDRKNEIIKNFSNPDSLYKVMVLTFSSGGTGLNLQCANNCIFLNPNFVNTTQQQAIGRINRLGQKKEVNVYILLRVNRGENSPYNIEERIFERCVKQNIENKNIIKTSNLIYNRNKHDNEKIPLSADELVSLLKTGKRKTNYNMQEWIAGFMKNIKKNSEEENSEEENSDDEER